MEPVHITPQASSDIAKLEQGVDRTQVALEALKEANPNGEQVEQLKALLKQVAPTVDATSATTSPAVGRIETVDGHQAVVGKISVKGQQLDTLLSEGAFNKTRADQETYAEKLGYRGATREENREYVKGLLAKEDSDTINHAEKNALKTYRERYVRDPAGGLDVDGRRVRDHSYNWDDLDYPNKGALFVRASAESK